MPRTGTSTCVPRTPSPCSASTWRRSPRRTWSAAGTRCSRSSVARAPFKFSAETRVGFSDTDAQGVVYYGRYMPYFDLARVEYHRQFEQVRAELGSRQFVMRAMNVEYHAPARFDDLIEVDVRISRIGTSSVTYEFAAYLEGERLAVTATQVLVLVDLDERKPCAIPQSWRDKIGEFEGDELEA